MESEKIDIISLDNKIKQYIEKETKNLKKYIADIKKLKSENNIGNKKKIVDLEIKIQDLESGAYLAEYILLTEKIIKEYLDILKVPVSLNFFDNKIDNGNNNKIKQLTDEFIDIAGKYINININKIEKVNNIKCKCGNISFVNKENSIFCDNCSIEIEVQNVQNSFKDIDRINTTQKYKYKKKVHFKDTVNQYQGKQHKKNSDDLLYSQLDAEFEKMGILVDSNNKHHSEGTFNFYDKYANITKDIIYMVLNETGNNKRYEDINLIHNHFTGILCPDISHLETQLYQDFDRVVEAYDSINNERKNFLNSKYVLYQLLRRHNYKVDDKDFDILKTRERLVDHDTIWKEICNKLDWVYKHCI